MTRLLRLLVGLVLTLCAALTGAALPNDDATILHVLNRLGYGARSGDVERVRRMGLEAWIDGQLHPDRIGDSVTEAALSRLPTIALSSRELMASYDLPREAKRAVRRARAEQPMTATGADGRSARRELLARDRGAMKGTPRQV